MGRKLRIGFPLSFSNGGPSLFMKRLRKSISKQKLANVSHFVNPFSDINIFSNLARIIYGKPYIFRVNGIYFNKRATARDNEIRNRPIFEGIDNAIGVVFQSSFSYELVVNFHKRMTKHYAIINNGVDIDIFSSNGSNRRKELGIRNNDLVFLTAAKWRVHKRLKDVINIFLEYEKNTNKTCHLLILGKDSHIKEIIHPHIHELRYVRPRDMPEWYRTGNVFLFLSWLDNCPNSVIEAIACGLPVVCSNQGGTKEIVEMTNGGIVAKTDEDFNFKPIDLYDPPKPDYDIIMNAINKIVENYDDYVQCIDRAMIDIDEVAKRYVGFIEKAYSNFKS